jgi:hypothetical protein
MSRFPDHVGIKGKSQRCPVNHFTEDYLGNERSPGPTAAPSVLQYEAVDTHFLEVVADMHRLVEGSPEVPRPAFQVENIKYGSPNVR